MRDEAQDRVDSATVSETKKLLGPQSLSQTDRPRGAEALHRDLVALLLEVYLNSVHPVFPLYCERELWIRWKDGSFPSTQPEWTSLTTMCALSMHHVRKGALFKDAVMPDHSDDLAEKLVYDAVESTPVDFYQQHDLEIVRAYGFLALLGIQSKNYSLTHRYLALWHGICGVRSLHDESKWPAQLNGCDREMRKRLFWVFYRLEVHMACVTGQIIRTPEAQCNVGYPEGSHHPAFVSGRDDSGRNRCGFQATHILATVHLVRITKLVLQRHSFHDILETARDMVQSMEAVPLDYLRAMGSPLLEKLTGVVFILNQLASKEHVPREAEESFAELIDAIVALFTSVKSGNEDAIETLENLKKQLKIMQTSPESTPVALHGFRATSTIENNALTIEDFSLLSEDNVDVPLWLLEMTSSIDPVYGSTLREDAFSGLDWEAP
ncbi:hypothetical protein LTR09_006320 [Extremus antarcticus]|uniref:Xylanolytic transcriptional activator regulatory domain-containing protein n=1 Tax=Extremus antarcticus TaxID=702011 RepID=A0AAJ0DEL1_9PEZI|nr:hypothetical protein LTR09_006320 [Extremus antarcticus]